MCCTSFLHKFHVACTELLREHLHCCVEKWAAILWSIRRWRCGCLSQSMGWSRKAIFHHNKDHFSIESQWSHSIANIVLHCFPMTAVILKPRKTASGWLVWLTGRTWNYDNIMRNVTNCPVWGPVSWALFTWVLWPYSGLAVYHLLHWFWLLFLRTDLLENRWKLHHSWQLSWGTKLENP